MPWILREPESINPLDQALALFETDACQVLAAGYRTLLEASAGAIPDKAELNLSAFARVLPHIALCAIVLPDQCIYRIAGEGLKQRMGFNPTGRNYYDMVPAARRDRAVHAMNMVVGIPCAFRAVIHQSYSDGPLRAVEAAGFPVISTDPGIDGFIIFADQAMRPPTGHADAANRLIGANVIRRDLIDLGFGVDREFRDLIEVG